MNKSDYTQIIAELNEIETVEGNGITTIARYLEALREKFPELNKSGTPYYDGCLSEAITALYRADSALDTVMSLLEARSENAESLKRIR